MCSKTGNIKKGSSRIERCMTNPHTGWWTKRCTMTAFPEFTCSYFSTVDLTDMLSSDATTRFVSSHCLSRAVSGASGRQRRIKHSPYSGALTLEDRDLPSPCPSAAESQVTPAWQPVFSVPFTPAFRKPPSKCYPHFSWSRDGRHVSQFSCGKTLSRLIQTFLFFSWLFRYFIASRLI